MRTRWIWRSWRAPIALVAGWYLLAWLTVRPLSEAPVVDSWLYLHAVKELWRSGHLRFAGFTEAMPAGQVVYGLIWSRLFGANAPSLDVSVAVLAVAGALMLYALARRCGAERGPALFASGLLICNPCYLFLSFSFMTEVPFIALLCATHLAFARADGARPRRWLWLTAALAIAAFTVRPFAAGAIVGTVIAIFLFDRGLRRDSSGPVGQALREISIKVLPFAIASVACVVFWIWMVHDNRPWKLASHEVRLDNYFFLVSAAGYLKLWLIGPALYLGLVLGPLAIVHAAWRWRRALPIALAIFAMALLVSAIEDRMGWTIPQCQCFGGSAHMLVLQGSPASFRWHDGAAGWIAAALGSAGVAGLYVVAEQVVPRMRPAAAAVMLTAAIYWIATLPLWLFADRYDLVMVPAGCLLLALAPPPRGKSALARRVGTAAALAMTAVMGFIAIGGLYASQRGAEAVLRERNRLLAQGVPRSKIDAGYALNGQDLYRYPPNGTDTRAEERGIAMITTKRISEYTIAAAPLPGTETIRRFSWPGPFGFGSRPLYVLRAVAPPAPPVNRAAGAQESAGNLKQRFR